MDFTQSVAAITALVKANIKTPILLKGEPGTGKSAVHKHICTKILGMSEEDANIANLRLAHMDPVDILGVPYVDKETNRTHFAPNGVIWRALELAYKYPVVVINLDELGQCGVAMHNISNAIIYDRRVGEQPVPTNIFFMATANNAGDRAGSMKMPTHTTNRLIVLSYESGLDAFIKYGLDTGIDPILLGYLRFKPDACHDFDSTRESNATLRSWEAASRIPTDLPRDIYVALLSGTVGEGRAAEYVSFRDTYHDLPSRESILLDPLGTPIPTTPSARYAVAVLLTQMASKDNLGQLAKYASRFTTELDAPEFEVIFYKDVAQTKPECQHTREFIEWASTRGAAVLM